MTTLRQITACLFFLGALGLLIQLFSAGFAWGLLLGAGLGFALAYALWPSKRHGHGRNDNSFLDLLEWVIEFPVELLLWLLRLVGGLFRGKGDGFDLDL